ncbi:hypothetical protein Pelo_6904 [Pelomyxa schiedti]|nr:hypothetical protein Pelo_6904 [Pelomyxa schiedti]
MSRVSAPASSSAGVSTNELATLTRKYEETHGQLRRVSARLAAVSNEKVRITATQGELNSCTASTPTFKSVGKMFLRTELAPLKHELSTVTLGLESEMQSLTKQQQYLQQSLSTMQRELLQMAQH